MVATMSNTASECHGRPMINGRGDTRINRDLPARRHTLDGVRRSKTIDFSNLNGYGQTGVSTMENGQPDYRTQRSISLNGVPDYNSYGMHRILEEDESRKCGDGPYHARPARATYDEPLVPRQRRTSVPDIPMRDANYSPARDYTPSPNGSPYGSKTSIESESEVSVQTPRGKYILMRSASDTKAAPDRDLTRNYNRMMSPMALFFQPTNGGLSKSCDFELLREQHRDPPPQPLHRQASLEEQVAVDTQNINGYVYLRGYNQNSFLSSSNSSNGSSSKFLKQQNGYYSDSSEDLLGSSHGSTTSDSVTGANVNNVNGAACGAGEARFQRLVDTLGLATTPQRSDTAKSDYYSSDEDEDDYGFLSHNSFASCSYPSAMHKAKSPSATRRIIPKKWRTKTSKLLKSVWTPEGDSTWAHVSGKKVVLGNTTLLNFSEVERLALQKIAIAKLQAMSLGCGILIPKDGSPTKRHKRTAFSLKRVRSNSQNFTGLLDNLAKAKEKEPKETPQGLVFGIPLSRSLANDLDHRRRRSFMLNERKDSLDLSNKNRGGARKSSSSSISSTDNLSPHLDRGPMCGFDSLPRTDRSMFHGQTSASTSLIDALSLHSTSSVSTGQDSSSIDHRKSLLPSVPQVPNVVSNCCKHLETYGLQTLGIFRIGSSKKRIKQLREEFDSGKDVKLNEEHNPHDVGALLKEFYRDLPEPLLTRELYAAFIATRKLKEKHQHIKALQLLVSLLPVPNRDTLWSLLKFLHKVAEHSTDTTDEQGQVLSGNKMDAHNLATLFGPNILHKVKGGAGHEFQVESLERAEERKDIIEIVKDMITYNTKLYEVPSDIHDDVLQMLVESNPDGLDFLLKRKCDDMQITIDIDPDSTSGMYDESDNSPPPTASPTPKREGIKIRTLSDAISLIHHHKPLRSTCSDAPVQAQKSRQRDYLTVPSRNSYRRSMPDPGVLGNQNYPEYQPTRSASEKAPSNKSLVPANITRTNSSPVVMRRQQQRKNTNLTVETSNPDDESTSSGYVSRSPLRGSSNSVCYPQSPTKTMGPGQGGSLQRKMHRWSVTPSPSSGPTSPPSPRVLSPEHKATSSMQRPLGFFPASSRDNVDAPTQNMRGGDSSSSQEWQDNNWRNFQTVPAKRSEAERSIDQETLV